MCSLLKDEFVTWSEFEDCPRDDAHSFIQRHSLQHGNVTKLHYAKCKAVCENASLHGIANADIALSELKMHVKTANDKIKSKDLEPHVSQQEMIGMLSTSPSLISQRNDITSSCRNNSNLKSKSHDETVHCTYDSCDSDHPSDFQILMPRGKNLLRAVDY